MNPSPPSPLVVSIAHEQKKMANILASLDLFISPEGSLADASGVIHPNALNRKLVNRYHAEGGSLTGKAATNLAEKTLIRLHSALVKARRIASANHDSAS